MLSEVVGGNGKDIVHCFWISVCVVTQEIYIYNCESVEVKKYFGDLLVLFFTLIL